LLVGFALSQLAGDAGRRETRFRRGKDMNCFLLTTAMMLSLASIRGCVEVTPNQTGGPGGIRTNNVNTTNANSQIRLWILTEQQIANPPQTKRAAGALENFVQPRFRLFTFNRNAGTYYVVASNETHYQSLTDTEPFASGVDFALLEVKVEGKLVLVSVSNTTTSTRLPRITSP